jgi:DNA polymerase-3 subunit epsilon
MMKNFTAIDFETAHNARCSVCQVGLVRVENGKIVDELCFLVQPPDNEYLDRLIEIHGITPEDTADASTFDVIWPKIEPYIADQAVVAHNGFIFDFHCIDQSLEYYGLSVPEYEKYCTNRVFGERLEPLCETYNIPLDHHNALSDAKACAELFLIHQNKKA